MTSHDLEHWTALALFVISAPFLIMAGAVIVAAYLRRAR